VLNPHISLFEPIAKLNLHPFVLFLVAVHHSISFFELFLKFYLFLLEILDDRGVSLFDVFDVSRMNFSDSLFEMIDLELVLTLNCVNLLF
jgi:hypothetical protein